MCMGLTSNFSLTLSIYCQTYGGKFNGLEIKRAEMMKENFTLAIVSYYCFQFIMLVSRYNSI